MPPHAGVRPYTGMCHDEPIQAKGPHIPVCAHVYSPGYTAHTGEGPIEGKGPRIPVCAHIAHTAHTGEGPPHTSVP
jgi:hypothetical protein